MNVEIGGKPGIHPEFCPAGVGICRGGNGSDMSVYPGLCSNRVGICGCGGNGGKTIS